MKKLNVSLFLLASLACGKSLEKQVEDQVRTFDNVSLAGSQVQVKTVRTAGDQAVAEVQITTAVRLAKKDEKWVIEEFRIGDRHWEKAGDILAAINQRRTGRTLERMKRISEGVQRYADLNGQVPQVSDFEELIDLLSPQFLDRIIWIDAWSNPFSYQATGTNQYDLRSAGPDGSRGTADDLVSGMTNLE